MTKTRKLITPKLKKLGKITINRNPDVDNDVLNVKYFEDGLDKKNYSKT